MDGLLNGGLSHRRKTARCAPEMYGESADIVSNIDGEDQVAHRPHRLFAVHDSKDGNQLLPVNGFCESVAHLDDQRKEDHDAHDPPS